MGEYLRYNVSQNDNGKIKQEISDALENGLNFGLLCAQGMIRNINGKDVFTGSCKGDSGGPLKSALREKDTLIGIVSVALVVVLEYQTGILRFHITNDGLIVS